MNTLTWLIKSWRVVLFIAGISLAAYAMFKLADYHNAKRQAESEMRIARLEITRLNSDNQLQRQTIALQSMRMVRFNQIAAAVNQHNLIIKAKSDEQQIIYRTVIRKDPAGRQCVPDHIAERLLSYTYRLRSRTVPAAAGLADETHTGSVAAACRLTYGQAVYWIHSLLTTLDDVLQQLESIRQAEDIRRSEVSPLNRDAVTSSPIPMRHDGN